MSATSSTRRYFFCVSSIRVPQDYRRGGFTLPASLPIHAPPVRACPLRAPPCPALPARPCPAPPCPATTLPDPSMPCLPSLALPFRARPCLPGQTTRNLNSSYHSKPIPLLTIPADPCHTHSYQALHHLSMPRRACHALPSQAVPNRALCVRVPLHSHLQLAHFPRDLLNLLHESEGLRQVLRPHEQAAHARNLQEDGGALIVLAHSID